MAPPKGSRSDKTRELAALFRHPAHLYTLPMLTTKSIFAAEGLDDRSLEFLTNALEKNNLPSFDYFEFKRAVTTLLGMNIDEATAFKSAFATAATVGLTKDKLLETAGYYRSLLAKEKEQFDEALQNQNATKVASRQQEVKRLRDQIERHKADIARLQDEMAAYLNQIESAEAAAKTEGEKLDKTRLAFEKAHASVTMQIDKDIELVHKHL